jgi:hypothetical protein
MSSLELLKARVDATADAHRRAKAAFEAALIAAQPFKPGDIIRSAKGSLARVDGYVMPYGAPRLRASLQKKDGSFGKRPIAAWSQEWQHPVKVEQP